MAIFFQSLPIGCLNVQKRDVTTIYTYYIQTQLVRLLFGGVRRSHHILGGGFFMFKS